MFMDWKYRRMADNSPMNIALTAQRANEQTDK